MNRGVFGGINADVQATFPIGGGVRVGVAIGLIQFREDSEDLEMHFRFRIWAENGIRILNGAIGGVWW